MSHPGGTPDEQDDNQQLLREQVAELMIEREAAQLATRRAWASLPCPKALDAVKAALRTEQQIAARLHEVRDKLTS
jgi:hypothetical protein